MMRNRIVTMLCLAAVLVLLAASSEGSPVIAQSGAKKEVSYSGISFTYDTSLAKNVLAQTMPEQKGDTQPWWLAHPEHVVFKFEKFSGGQTYTDPGIYVFPIKSSYRSLNIGDLGDRIWLGDVNKLRSLISQRRKLDVSSYVDAVEGPLDAAPLLPPINAATVPIGKQEYIRFGNGIGLRCFTFITQEVGPIEREGTIYTFQGLSDDGKYYVAAIFPAFLANPPATVDPGSPYDPYVGNYNRLIMKAIEDADSSAFAPDLDKLDEIVKSLDTTSAVIGSPRTSAPGMPRTGAAAPTITLLAFATLLLLALAGMILRYARGKCSD